jgi:hypothetical protein
MVGALFGVGELVAGRIESNLGADQGRLVGEQLVEDCGDRLALEIGVVGA